MNIIKNPLLNGLSMVPVYEPSRGNSASVKIPSSVNKKKEKELSHVNEDDLKRRKHCQIQVEMDEMGSFYKDKKHQIWLWQAIDHETSEVITYVVTDMV